ncbi:unnamed protein product (macronuclear) [Paramecium tetraurelia]|uniref:Uncharacterized protein n=1 Tax=Paramecium tetraurelia TaxID=5888 RepID=A0E350_PARTE|nr:uncharacterized protein GSPATT00022890001 [Paramecium tetraurelia]CAK89717.1 unnamed protein product [Paramecium tetraurelia]|eukprot:XP_001457114.1 hypothetical protein (macronuclear) [Paramecium tetraurelia strain d4-2]
MIRNNEILTKSDRQNSHLDSYRAKFQIAGQTILNGDSSFTQEPTNRNIYETERTDHQSFLQKIGYSVSQELNQQEYQKKLKASPVSTELQSAHKVTNRDSQQYSIAPRGQSIEISNNNDQFLTTSESPYNPQNIRKMFHYCEGSYEYLSDNIQSGSSDHTPKPTKSESVSIKTISTNDIPTMIRAKFKRIRKCFQIITALFRMKTLCNQKQSSWNLQMDILKRNQKILKYNESISIIKIKQWTQMVFSKMISIIQQKNLEKQKLNFIDYPQTMTSVEIDQAIVFVQNSFTFAMSNLVVMTTGKYLINELSLQMHQDQYFEYRKQFSKFVSERANYLTKDYTQLNEQEKQLVFSECIIINNLIPSLLKLTISLEALKCNIGSIEFLMRCIISLFQYFFIHHFSNYPKVEMRKQNIKYTQYDLTKNGSQLILSQNQQLNSEGFINGIIYSEEQMQQILQKESWLQANKKKMNIVSQNLGFIV